MTFEECVKKYPMYKTYVGNYDIDSTFKAHCYEDVANIDRWDYAPLDWGSGALPFVIYNSETDEFECWYYAYWTVQGYINETDDPNNFYPATNSESFGWEKVDFNNTNDVILPPIQIINEENEYYERVRQAARLADSKAYDEGRVFLTYDAVKNFCSKMEKNS